MNCSKRPLKIRVGCDSTAPDLARGNVLEHEDMHLLEAFGRQYLVGQEVRRRRQHVPVRVEEALPVVRLRPVGREDAMLCHDPTNCPYADFVPKVHEVVGDVIVAPGGVLAGNSREPTSSSSTSTA